MTNTFSKIDEERIRIASETRAISELQKRKRFLATTTINKKTKEANSFAKGDSKSRTASAPQSYKKAIINQNAIKPAKQISIAEQNKNDSRRITIARRKDESPSNSKKQANHNCKDEL